MLMSSPAVPTIKTMPEPAHMRTHPSGNDVDLSHPKLAAAEAWVSQRLGGSAHERRVAWIAATLFDLAAPLHGLTSLADRRLLQLAALVHDVGRCAGKPGHPAAGAAMVLSDEAALPLTAAERRAVAYLTLHHRGPVPEIGDDDVLHDGEDDAGRLLKLLALLRAADALDSRSLESPQLVFALLPGTAANARPRLRVTCYLQTDSAKARRVYERRKKFRLLEDVLGCRVEVEIVQAQALRMVA